MPKITLSSDELPDDIGQGENFYIRVRAVSLDENRTSHWVYHEVVNNNSGIGSNSESDLVIGSFATRSLETYYEPDQVWSEVVFTDDTQFEVKRSIANARILIVGGGGGAGNGTSTGHEAGGGGAGQVVSYIGYNLNKGIYNVDIGAGGARQVDGQNSVLTLPSGLGSITAYGGGRGRSNGDSRGTANGSGGGGSHSNTAGVLTNNPTIVDSIVQRYANNGATPGAASRGGGGGGAAAAGSAYNGGNGLEWPVGSGNLVGAGGAGHFSNTASAGGTAWGSQPGASGIANTGGGGNAGNSSSSSLGGSGGSGVIKIAYRIG